MRPRTRTYEEIRAGVATAFARAQQLAEQGAVSVAPTLAEAAVLRDALAAITTSAADLLDELLGCIRAGRAADRVASTDEAHAVASAAAGQLRRVLRSLRWTAHPEPSTPPDEGTQARDRVHQIGALLAIELIDDLAEGPRIH